MIIHDCITTGPREPDKVGLTLHVVRRLAQQKGAEVTCMNGCLNSSHVMVSSQTQA